MTFFVSVLLHVAAGLALLRLTRLSTGRWGPDLPLAWFVGTGWFAAVAPVLRFACGLPLGRATTLAILLAPAAAWAGLGWWDRRGERPGPGEPAGGAAPAPSGAGAGVGTAGRLAPFLPRPGWLFGPLAAYVLVVLAVVLLHGTNTPTQTDDAVRVRAFAPILAFEDEWSPEARAIFSMAGPLPTFVPAVGWLVTGTVDHFHVNYFVLAELVAALALVIGLGTARGSPERGWAGAFALLSLPLFVYHSTATYSDSSLAIRIGVGVLFAMEYARTRDRADASRSLLLLAIAALVKREGELVAAAPVAVVLAQLAFERWREARPFPWRSLGLLLPPVLGAVGKIAAVGLAGAFPMATFVAGVAVQAATRPAAAAPVPLGEAAGLFFDRSLFRTGNQGMLYWVALAALGLRARAIVRGPALWPVLALLALFAEVAVSSVLLVPEFTVNQGTVHRALLVVSVPLALWTAATIVDAVRAETAAPSTAPAKGAPGGEGASGDATRPGRRRARPPRRR